MYDEDSDRGTHWAMRAVRDDSLRPGRSPPGSAWCANNVICEGTTTDSDCRLASKWGTIKCYC